MGLRRVALRQFTTAGVGAPMPVTLIADLVPGNAGLRLLNQIASQDWPALEILPDQHRRPTNLPRASSTGVGLWRS